MATMRVGIWTSALAAKPVGATFEGTISLPTVITAPIQINSAKLHMKAVRVYNKYCYLTLTCGTMFGWTGVLANSDGSAVMRESGVTVQTSGNILAENNRKITFKIETSNASYGGNYFGIYSYDEFWLDIDYTVLESASTLGLSTTAVDAGGTVTANIGAGVGAASHKVVWQFGGRFSEATVSGGVLSSPLAVPLAWLDQIPNALSGIASCTLTTYNAAGAQIGSPTTAYFSISCPASVVPTIGSFTAEGISQSWGLYLQGRSQAKLTASSAAGAYGSTITGYHISGGGFSAAANTLTTGTLNAAGGITFTATVTDSRGRQASRTVAITVTGYSPPKILSTTEERCDAAGNVSRQGLYARCIVKYDYTVIGSNARWLSIAYKRADLSTWTSGYEGVPTSGAAMVIGGGGLNGGYSWDISYTFSDALQSVTVQKRVGTAEVLLHFRPTGDGIGVGGMCEASKRLQLGPGWDILYQDGSNPFKQSKVAKLDCNQAYKSGVFTSTDGSTFTNAPNYLDNQGTLVVIAYNAGAEVGWLRQTFISAHDGTTFERYKSNTAWSGWKRFRDKKSELVIDRDEMAVFSFHNLAYRGYATDINACYQSGFYVTYPATQGNWPASAPSLYGMLNVYNTINDASGDGYIIQELHGITNASCVWKRHKWDGGAWTPWFRFVGTTD